MRKPVLILLAALLWSTAAGMLTTAGFAQTDAEIVLAPFAAGTASATTTGPYSGEVWLYVRGTGKASGPGLSDAFFVYTDGSGKVLPPPGVLGINQPHPWHASVTYNWVLWTNGQTADYFVVPGAVPTIPPSTVPQYNPAHLYAFPIGAPGGPLTFGVGDTGTKDNSGAYVVTAGTRSLALNCYLADVGHRIARGYIKGDIMLSNNDLFVRVQNASRDIMQGNDAGARTELQAAVQIVQQQKGALITHDMAGELLAAMQYFLGLLP